LQDQRRFHAGRQFRTQRQEPLLVHVM
jgi:hypothetical protein